MMIPKAKVKAKAAAARFPHPGAAAQAQVEIKIKSKPRGKFVVSMDTPVQQVAKSGGEHGRHFPINPPPGPAPPPVQPTCFHPSEGGCLRRPRLPCMA